MAYYHPSSLTPPTSSIIRNLSPLVPHPSTFIPHHHYSVLPHPSTLVVQHLISPPLPLLPRSQQALLYLHFFTLLGLKSKRHILCIHYAHHCYIFKKQHYTISIPVAGDCTSYEYICAFCSMQQTFFFFTIMFTHVCLKIFMQNLVFMCYLKFFVSPPLLIEHILLAPLRRYLPRFVLK